MPGGALSISHKALLQHFHELWGTLEKHGCGPSHFNNVDKTARKNLWEWSYKAHWDEEKKEGSALAAERYWMTITDEIWKGADTREYPPDSFEPLASEGRTLAAEESEGRTFAGENEGRTFIEPSEGRTLTAPQEEQPLRTEDVVIPRRIRIGNVRQHMKCPKRMCPRKHSHMKLV